MELHARSKPYRGNLNGPLIVSLLGNQFDADSGLMLEGSMRVTDSAPDALVKAELIPTIAGFLIQTSPKAGTAVRLSTLGVTEIGQLNLTGPEPVFDSRDVTGRGCATVAGIVPGRDCTFRLLVRKDMFELYLDDLFVQTFFLLAPATGHVGFLVQNGSCTFSNVRIWRMSL